MEPIRVYFENDRLVVCEKPSGVVSEAGGLPDLLCTQKGYDMLYPVHRLDKMVTGGILYAKTKETAAALSEQIRNGTFSKVYAAVCEGKIQNGVGTWEDLLFYDRKQGKSFVVKKERSGVKKALLQYEVHETACDEAGNPYSLCFVKLITGRTHQVRVQFSSRGYPLYGDRRYGSTVRDDGFGLKSYRLSFSDPGSGERIELEFPFPNITPWNKFDSTKDPT